ncbi:MAG TPA: orotate phosphoribosyltransferase [Cyclobacteriaceae bacterium]|nr:orotate phosphoribosyltransferase [Cyclobacteriaceae bacterium]
MVKDIHTARQVATHLLEIEAVKLNTAQPFRWASGWRAPVYCDNRLTLSYPAIRKYISNGISTLIHSEFPKAEGIAGVATAGIPQAALVADSLSLPLIYVRSKAKTHGLANQIEGRMAPGSKMIILEDLVSTGGSSLGVVDVLREAKLNVLGMVSIFTYGFRIADAAFSEKKVPLYSLCDYATLIDVARDLKYISNEQITELKSWWIDPTNWKT